MAETEPFDQFALGVGRDTWELFRRDPAMFIIAGLAMLFGTFISLGLLGGVLNVGFVELVRRARRGEPISVGIVFSRFDALIPSLIASLIIGIAVLIGFFLMVLPALVVGFFSLFTLHAITYENLGGIDAIRRSIELVRANVVYALTLIVCAAVITSLGGVIFVGILLSTPLVLIGLTVGYERVTGLAPSGTQQVLSI